MQTFPLSIQKSENGQLEKHKAIAFFYVSGQKKRERLQWLLLLYCCAAMLWEGQHQQSHCDSLQWLSPRSPWMTCLPMYLAGREVFGVSGGGVYRKRARMWLKSQESAELVYHCNHVSFDCQTKGFGTGLFFLSIGQCISKAIRLLSVMFLYYNKNLKGCRDQTAALPLYSNTLILKEIKREC